MPIFLSIKARPYETLGYRDGLSPNWFEAEHGRLPVSFYWEVLRGSWRTPVRTRLPRVWNETQVFRETDDRPGCIVVRIPKRGLIAIHDGRLPAKPGVRTEIITKKGGRIVIEDLDQYIAGWVNTGDPGTNCEDGLVYVGPADVPPVEPLMISEP
jgi:hypothetical protein